MYSNDAQASVGGSSGAGGGGSDVGGGGNSDASDTMGGEEV